MKLGTILELIHIATLVHDDILDDADIRRSPGLPERCNAYDDDCDLDVDEGFDADGDGFTVCGVGPGTADCNDGCPNDPNKTDPGICGCGTPDTDSDGDGTPDCNDGCPDDPYKTDPGL